MGLPPPDPRSLCPQLNLLNPPEQNSWVRHCYRVVCACVHYLQTSTMTRPASIWVAATQGKETLTTTTTRFYCCNDVNKVTMTSSTPKMGTAGSFHPNLSSSRHTWQLFVYMITELWWRLHHVSSVVPGQHHLYQLHIITPSKPSSHYMYHQV